MKVLLGVGGGIAAYKIPVLLRLLQQAGHEVQIMMSPAAAQFVSPLVLQALSGRPVRQDLWDATAELAMGHIELARWADVICIAPLTANTAAKLAHGLADNLLSAVCLASARPLLLAPAMNTQMWLNPATQANMQTLRRRHRLLEPESGALACGEVGAGRMPEPEALLQAIEAMPLPQDLRGKRFVITAGATREAIDPVRFISNRSSGKMAFALAEAAWARGATVTVVAGAVQASPPFGIEVQRVESALEMLAAVEALPCDVFIGAAAVADYRPAQSLAQKHKKSLHGTLSLQLEENPDIVATVAQRSHRPWVLAFAAETEALLEHARAKMQRKKADMLVANDVSGGAMFGQDEGQIHLLDGRGGVQTFRGGKRFLAAKIIENIAESIKIKHFGENHAGAD